jgi:tRNA(fMet)-specific endonuclease VapC
MTRYLLDTNIVSDVMRNPDGSVEQALREHADADIGISLIVKGEILFGLVRNANAKGKKRFDALLKAIETWPMQEGVADIYAQVRATMEITGKKMGPNDMWIAAHSLSLDAVLVTDDRRFHSVPDLKVENWLREAAPMKEAGSD